MNRFVKRSIFAILTVTTLLSAITFVTDNGLRKSEKYLFKDWNDIISGAISSDIIVMGSSRAKYQYNPRIIDSILNINSYNLGIAGTHFNTHLLRLTMCIEHGIIPKTIILNVDEIEIPSTELVNKFQYYPYFSEKNIREYIFPKLSFREKHIYPLKYMGLLDLIYAGSMEFFNIKHYTDDFYKGFHGYSPPWDPTFIQEYIKNSPEAKYNKEYDDLFHKYMDICKENNIKIILIYAPVYFEIINATKNFEKISEYYTNILNEYDDCYFIDYSHDSLSFDSKYFFKPTHMNLEGSNLFTEKMCRDIAKLL